jgi:hypothetical protein
MKLELGEFNSGSRSLFPHIRDSILSATYMPPERALLRKMKHRCNKKHKKVSILIFSIFENPFFIGEPIENP